ncbi:MAG: hypothetical protein FJX47_21645 [Alphaproteobacteria bacterium]|nr:hypothetical protein [Alphaproteobacteria bacterium]
MIGPRPPRCPLGRALPGPPTGEDELRRLRERAWREQGVAVLPLAEIHDAWIRQAITNEAERLYGRRRRHA